MGRRLHPITLLLKSNICSLVSFLSFKILRMISTSEVIKNKQASRQTNGRKRGGGGGGTKV